MSAEDVAKAFVQHYYTTLDQNPQGLAGLYQPTSVLMFEGRRFEGPQNISLGQLSHNIPQLTMDMQMGASNNALMVFVTGHIKIGGDNPLHFSQCFQLIATGPGQYYVHNEFFRLIYG